MAYKMRKPLVNNKYNLTIKKLKKYKVADRTFVGAPFFWRNDVIQAWCISGNAGSTADQQFGTDNSFWIGIYACKEFCKETFRYHNRQYKVV